MAKSDTNIKHKRKKKTKYRVVPKKKIFKSLKTSLKTNFIFYISVIISSIIISFDKSKLSVIKNIWSFIIVSGLGYISHYVEHKISAMDYYINSNNIFKHIPIIKKLVEYSAKIFDFHHTTHHDTEINKKSINIFYEFLNNFFAQGLAVYLFIKISKTLDETVCIIWGLLYATVHNINYLISPPSTHIYHHVNDKTNFGIDIYDIVFGTKSDWDDIENINHYSWNLIILTLVIYLFRK